MSEIDETTGRTPEEERVWRLEFRVKSAEEKLEALQNEKDAYKLALEDIKAEFDDPELLEIVDKALGEKTFGPKARRKTLNLGELAKQINDLLTARPHMADATVYVDTEARKYPCHMVEVDGFWAEEDEHLDNSGIGKYVYLTPDDAYTTH